MAEIPKEQVVKVRAELDNAVVVRPGDKLVIGFHRLIARELADEIATAVGTKLPGVEIVIADGVSGLAVYRDEPTGVIQLSQTLTAGEVQSLRERGVIGEDGKTTGDRIAVWLSKKQANGS